MIDKKYINEKILFYKSEQDFFHLPIKGLISSKYISGIHFLLYIIQHTIITVSNNRLTLLLESYQVVHHPATEEQRTVFQCRFVDDDRSALCLDALHHSLDGTLAEIVAACLHGEAIYTDNWQLRVDR